MNLILVNHLKNDINENYNCEYEPIIVNADVEIDNISNLLSLNWGFLDVFFYNH